MNDNIYSTEQLNTHGAEQIRNLNKRRVKITFFFSILYLIASSLLIAAGMYSYQAYINLDPLGQIVGGFSIIAVLIVTLFIAKAQARNSLAHFAQMHEIKKQTL